MVTPIAGKPAFFLGAYESEEIGYLCQEYVVSGDATSYAMPDDPPPKDGRWNAKPDDKAAFSTRVVTLLPADSTRFNGSVVVEWLNVTGGVDSPAVWLMAHREMLRGSYAYVAVSAQKMGVEGGTPLMGQDHSLKKRLPERYGALHHPGDEYSYDIFSQVGRLVRKSCDGGILGDLVPQRLIAVGESQAAIFLATYVNALDTLAKVYDGFLVHSRPGAVSHLNGEMELGSREARTAGVRFRPDLRVPVMNFITEADLVGFPEVIGYHIARQPDNRRLRTWELPGASHADNYTIAVSFIDTGFASPEALAAAYAPTNSILGMPVPKPINFGPQHHYVLQAAFHELEQWVRSGKAPPTSPRIELADSTGTLALDAHGMAKGGIRTPWIEVPTARLSSEGNSESLMATIFGTSEVFDQTTLHGLYPGGKAAYLKRFEAALDHTIQQGFILSADRLEILKLAAIMYPEK